MYQRYSHYEMLCSIALALFCIQNALSATSNEALTLALSANVNGLKETRSSQSYGNRNQQTIERFAGEADTQRVSVRANEGENESNILSETKDGENALPQIFPAFMPEDVRYAKVRCATDFPRANLNWTLQNFNNDAEANETYCYVKCFLRRIGFIRLDTLGWDLDRLSQIYLNLGADRTFEPNCFDWLNEAMEMSGKCEPHYKVWMNLFKHCQLGFKYFFYNDVQPKELPFITPLPPSREIGLEPIKFCSNLFSKENIDIQSPIYTLCIYQQLHYFDGYGRLQESEIIRSFKESGRLTPVRESLINACSHHANSFFMQNSKEMAKQLSNCMIKNLPEDFSFVVKYWNQVMRDF